MILWDWLLDWLYLTTSFPVLLWFWSCLVLQVRCMLCIFYCLSWNHRTHSFVYLWVYFFIVSLFTMPSILCQVLLGVFCFRAPWWVLWHGHDKRKDYICIMLRNNPTSYGRHTGLFIFSRSISEVSLLEETVAINLITLKLHLHSLRVYADPLSACSWVLSLQYHQHCVLLLFYYTLI